MKEERLYHGIPVSSGIVHGYALLHYYKDTDIPKREVTDNLLPAEVERLKLALRQARREILEIQEGLALSMGKVEAKLFDAHLLLLEDPMLLEETLTFLRRERCNIEYALYAVAKRACESFEATKNSYLRERVLDIEDITRRILKHLLGNSEDLSQVEKTGSKLDKQKKIILSSQLTPSHVALLFHDHVAAFVTEQGSKTSHAAILARALNIPSLAGIENLLTEVEGGEELLLDGEKGILIVNPSEDSLREHQEMSLRKKVIQEQISLDVEAGSVHEKLRHICLTANVELPSQVSDVKAQGAEGIGLYRSEFLYFNRSSLPSEEELYHVFSYIAEQMAPSSVVIRTCDLGADKITFAIDQQGHQAALGKENYSLSGGSRGIRFCLKNKELFKTQLRAILRAAVLGNIKMMYPMISGVQELLDANACLEECKKELASEGIPYADNLSVGVMIETPSAVIIADYLAEKADFFSIGTNDLIQYLLALDRCSELTSYFYHPTHPSVIKSLKMIVDAAHRHHIKVSICGEIAGDVLLTPLLLGLGIDEFSVAPRLIPKIKRALQILDPISCRLLADELLQGDQAQLNYQHCLDTVRACYGVYLNTLVTL